MGSVAGVAWPIGLMMLALWLLTAWLTRISSAGAIVSFVALPILGLLFAKSGTFEVFAMVVSTLILVRHKDNLQRLWNRSEPRMGESR
jgi:glycerol-3-phosphate acyltransferase PlsY